jgi:hypothetical protein
VVGGGSSAEDMFFLRIKESTTVLALSAAHNNSNISATNMTFHAVCVLTPSSGSHTYKLSMERAIGTGTIAVKNSVSKGFILIEDIGPA